MVSTVYVQYLLDNISSVDFWPDNGGSGVEFNLIRALENRPIVFPL